MVHNEGVYGVRRHVYRTVTSGAQIGPYAYYPTSGLLLNTTTFTGGTNLARTYDSFGRLQSITTTPAADTAVSYTYTYNNLNQRTRVTREDGSYWSYAYNDRGELIFGKKYWSDNAPVVAQQNEYVFDNLGNRTSTLAGGDAAGASLRSATHTSNALNQYSQLTVPGAVDIIGSAAAAANVTVNGQAAYRRSEYFAQTLTLSNTAAPVYAQATITGVRTGAGQGGQDVVTNQSGYVYLPKTPEVFTYDLDGNLTSDGRWTYTWDAENRLTTMTAIAGVPNAAKRRLEFVYDAMGRRVQKKVYTWNAITATYQLQSTTKFVYDGWNVVAEIAGSGALIRSYVWGGTGMRGIGSLLVVSEGSGSYLAGYDGGGSVTTLVNSATGGVAASYDYGPFGETIRANGDYAGHNPVRFNGKYTDTESGLIYYGYRYYDPSTGRWITRDPVEEHGGNNLYAFVSNDAANHFDVLGLKRFRITGTAFIPWEWVQMPEPPPVDVVVGPVALLLDGFVHGDGRGPGEKPGGSYRLTASVEVEVLEKLSKSGIVDPPFTNNGESVSQIRTAIGGYVIKEQRARGTFTPANEAIKVKRLNFCFIQIEMKMSGNVPAKVAGIPFQIDYEYFILLRQKTDGKYVADMSGFHDGFPGHEMFLESEGRVLFTRHYLPSWFAPEAAGKGTAHPSVATAARGGLALSGQSDRQKWNEQKEY